MKTKEIPADWAFIVLLAKTDNVLSVLHFRPTATAVKILFCFGCPFGTVFSAKHFHPKRHQKGFLSSDVKCDV